jgi:hypothetical protein
LRARRATPSGCEIEPIRVEPDEFEEGGYRQSGLGRLNGVASIDSFVEYKHIMLSTATPGAQGCGHSPPTNNHFKYSDTSLKWKEKLR